MVQISHFPHNALILFCKISACSGAPRDSKNQLNITHPSFMSWRVRVRCSFFVGSRLVWSLCFLYLTSFVFGLDLFVWVLIWVRCPFVSAYGALCIFISVTFYFLGQLHLYHFRILSLLFVINRILVFPVGAKIYKRINLYSIRRLLRR